MMMKLIRQPDFGKEEKKMKQFYDMSLIEPHLGNKEEAYAYLKTRGVSMKAIERFKVGYNKETGSLVFPCIDWEGRLTGWIERNEIWDNRYGYKPEGVNRENLIFGMDRNIELAFLVEGVVDAMKLITWGLEAIAVNGNTLFESQVKDIVEHCKTICIIPDNDKAGEILIEKAKSYFKGVVDTFISFLPEGIKDVGDGHLDKDTFINNYKENVQFMF
jgi:DNA primase